MTSVAPSLPGSPSTGVTVPQKLSSETRTKLDADAKAWVLATKKLNEPTPPKDLAWVQQIADGTTTDQLQITSVVQAYTTATAADKQKQDERTALEAFVASALELIKQLALEAPVEAQQILEGHKAKLKAYVEEQKKKNDELAKSVQAIQALIDEIAKASAPAASAT